MNPFPMFIVISVNVYVFSVTQYMLKLVIELVLKLVKRSIMYNF
jgi:hypothetical protein